MAGESVGGCTTTSNSNFNANCNTPTRTTSTHALTGRGESSFLERSSYSPVTCTKPEDSAEASSVRERSLQHAARLSILSDVEGIAPVYRRTQTQLNVNADSPVVSIEKDEVDLDDLLDQEVEGLEYDPVQNAIFSKEVADIAKQPKRFWLSILRYLVLFLIGSCTGLAAFLFDYSIEFISNSKFSLLSLLLRRFHSGWAAAIPGITWCAFNGVLVCIAAAMVVFIAPVAGGSGIPQIKCYLNGINVPHVMRALTMLVKGVGVVLAVSGGLAVGKEGPMIHVGSVIAAGISQGRIAWCRRGFSCFRAFRNHVAKRDFVSAGAAAGVAVAFGAPVGGLLFALEEGASFVNQRITWAILFCSTMSTFTLALLKKLAGLAEVKFTTGGLISFGSLTFLTQYNVYEIMAFALMGICGGLLGALFVRINTALTKYRQKNVNTKLAKITEAILVACLTASTGFGLMWLLRDCSPVAFTTAPFPMKMMCADNEFNSVATLFFSTPERSIRTLFRDPPSSFNILTLVCFFPLYYLLTCITFGLSVPSGLFIPGLLIGAGWGRVIGNLLHLQNADSFPDPGKFALIGAAAQLGGIVRMTVSLTVIMMEATGSVIVGLPILLTLLFAKYTGDYFNEGIYDLHISLSGMALLPWEPDLLAVTKRAYDVMCSPVIYLNPVMRVGDLVDRIQNDLHHGYPVVEGPASPARFSYGTLVGLISAEHLALLLQRRVFYTPDHILLNDMKIEDYDNAYPRFPKLQAVLEALDEADREAYIDLRSYMNEAPYRVPETMTMTRVFRLFRLLGLRHLPVVDNQNQLRGMITRKDLCRYKFDPTSEAVQVAELAFSRRM